MPLGQRAAKRASKDGQKEGLKERPTEGQRGRQRRGTIKQKRHVEEHRNQAGFVSYQ